jgi:NTP pyrophosphatase (non-canonical NTP hydrolase)
MADRETSIGALRDRVAAFVQARGWETFHAPKDLASAIAIEAAELMEVFLWKDTQEVEVAAHQPDTRQRIEEELADVIILCLSFANRLEIDVSDAVASKVAGNEAKYPADVVRGRAHKYTYYDGDV